MPGRKFTKDLGAKYKCFSKTNDSSMAKCNIFNSLISVAARGLYFSTSVFSNLLQFFNFRQKHELVVVHIFFNEFLYYTRASI